MPAVQINFSADSALKQQAESVCTKIGLSLTDAIRMFMRQIVSTQSLPLSTRVQDIQPELPEIQLSSRAKENIWKIIDQGDPKAEEKIARLLALRESFDVRSGGPAA